MTPLHAVIETAVYLAAADYAGMHEDERVAVVDLIARNPLAGEIMPGCGGARKLRFARSGGGKSGGYRIITYYGGDDIPVFLLGAYRKGRKDSLTHAERAVLASKTKFLRDSLTGGG